MARTRFVTRATRRCSRAPAETVSTASVRPADRRSGRMRPSAPAPSADDGAEVLGVLDLVENDDERFGRTGQDVVERGVALGRDFGHDALVAGSDLVETAGRDEDAGDVPGLGFADDLSDPGVALLLLDEDLVDPSGRGPEGFEERVDPDDPVHGDLPGHYMRIGRSRPELRGRAENSRDTIPFQEKMVLSPISRGVSPQSPDRD
jgi:hypothetical protein